MTELSVLPKQRVTIINEQHYSLRACCKVLKRTLDWRFNRAGLRRCIVFERCCLQFCKQRPEDLLKKFFRLDVRFRIAWSRPTKSRDKSRIKVNFCQLQREQSPTCIGPLPNAVDQLTVDLLAKARLGTGQGRRGER